LFKRRASLTLLSEAACLEGMRMGTLQAAGGFSRKELARLLALAQSTRGITSWLKRHIKAASHHTGLTRALAGLRPSGAFVIMYHKVERCPVGPFGMPHLDVAAFTRHIEYLARNYELMTLSALVGALRRGQLPRRAVALTFDDGYRNNLLLAHPVLQRFRAPATLFVTAGLIGTKQWMWPSELGEMALRYGLSEVGAKSGEPLLAGVFAADLPPAMRLSVGTELLLRLGNRRRTEVMARLRQSFAVEPDDENAFLSWDEVKALRAGGVEIGSHTLTHPVLTDLTPPELERELVGSKNLIAERTGHLPDLFCYPHGSFSQEVKAMTGRHYGAATSCIAGDNTPSTDPLELRRVTAYEVEELSMELARPR
jgi:peptidoglycan/xylan/chitin deacetylase (PgdA/CDA1 family)